MRETTDAAKVQELMRRLGAEARGEGRIYLVGGSSAVLLGWRAATVDVDLKLDPESIGVFHAIARAKNILNHYCPAISRINSTGYKGALVGFGDEVL